MISISRAIFRQFESRTNSRTRIYLLRHAEVETRYQRVFGGRIDMDLFPVSHQQALALATYMRRFQLDAIYASPMKRVQQTVSAVARMRRAPLPVVIDEPRKCILESGPASPGRK